MTAAGGSNAFFLSGGGVMACAGIGVGPLICWGIMEEIGLNRRQLSGLVGDAMSLVDILTIINCSLLNLNQIIQNPL